MLAARLEKFKMFKHKSESSKEVLSGHNKRVVANIDERRLYVNSGMSVDLYRIEEAGLTFEKSIEIFVVNSLVIIQEQCTNNLMIYKDGNQYKTIKGEGSWAVKDLTFEIKPCHLDLTFLWMRSANAVSIMTIGNLDNYTTIDKFWDDNPSLLAHIEPIAIVMNIKPQKVLGLATSLGKFFVRSYDLAKKKIRTFYFNEYKKELGFKEVEYNVVTIDKTQRKNVFFAAFNLTGKPPGIMQIRIATEGIQSVGYQKLEFQGFTDIRQMSTYSISNTDYVLVSGTNSLVLLKTADKLLTVMHVFQNIVVGDATDACIFRNRFFLVSPEVPFILEALATHNVQADKDNKKQMRSEEKTEEIQFEEFIITKLEIPGTKFNKIDISKKGDVLYVAGKGIAAITDINTVKPKRSDIVHDGKLFSNLKTLKNGNVLVQEAKTNDIIELSSTLKEIRRFRGTNGTLIKDDHIKSARHSHDDMIMPWMKDNHLVSLITIKDMSMKEVKNFFGNEGDTDVIPIMSVCNQNGEKVFGTSLFRQKMRLSYWEKSANTKYFELCEVCPSMALILCADMSQDCSTLFIGGSTSIEPSKGQAVLQAATFSKNLDYITDILIDEPNSMFVNKVRRFENSNRLLVLTSKSIHIYEYRNQLFNFAGKIENVLPGTWSSSDVLIHKSTLYLLSGENKFVQKIEFASK